MERGFLERRLVNKDFARLWSAMAVSGLGDAVFDTTLVLWIATVLGGGKSWAPVATSGVVIAASVAVIGVGPLAGVFADRWEWRRTMLRSEALRAVLVAILTAIAFLPTHALPTGAWLVAIYATVLLLNTAGQFFGPSRYAMISQIVPDDADRARAMGASQATSAAALMIGPPLAAPLLFTVGFQWALVLNAASYVFSFFVIRSVKVERVTHAPGAVGAGVHGVLRDLRGGFNAFAHSRYLVTLMIMIVVLTVGTGALNGLDVFFVTQNLNTNPHLYGLLSMADGCGVVLGSLIAGMVIRRLGIRRCTWMPLFFGGLLLFLYARQTQFWSALLLVVLIASMAGVVNVAFGPSVMKAVPSEFLGRVVQLINPIQSIASTLSLAVSGWLASTVLLHYHGEIAGIHMGRIDLIFTVGAALIFLGSLYGGFALPRDSAEREPSEQQPEIAIQQSEP